MISKDKLYGLVVGLNISKVIGFSPKDKENTYGIVNKTKKRSTTRLIV